MNGWKFGIVMVATLMTMPSNAMNAEAMTQQPWRIINDSVMGGLSESKLNYLPDEAAIRFSGELSLENNGGFASSRMVLAAGQFHPATAICIRVRGDGRRYQLRLRTGDRYHGIAFRHNFATQTDTWVEHVLFLDNFEPIYRGRLLSGIEPISSRQIRQVGFMLADKQPGTFRLDIGSVAPCRSDLTASR